MSRFKRYYYLTKPGIIYGNDLPAIGGFLLAAKGHISIGLFVSMLAGLSLIIASACVFNNYIDREIDSRMARTKRRPLAAGTISATNALIYAMLLGLVGSTILGAYVNLLTQLTALFGLFAYVVLYSVWKRKSHWGTVVGSISGAVPPVVGYVAVTDRLDLGALLLFLILVFWQMPHFYAIAVYRRDDYKAAGIPVLPLKKGALNVRLQMLGYILLFGLSCLALTVFGYSGYVFLAVMLAAAGYWLRAGLRGSEAQADEWGRGMFRISLLVVTIFSVMLAINAWLP